VKKIRITPGDGKIHPGLSAGRAVQREVILVHGCTLTNDADRTSVVG
jgi:hypothetical protein